MPIVAAFGSDPVKLGLAKSLNRPGGNVTGATAITTELVSKRVGLLCEVTQQVATVAYLNAGPKHSLPAAAQMTSEFVTAIRALQRREVILEVDSERDFETAFQSLVGQGAPALWSSPAAYSLTPTANRLRRLLSDTRSPPYFSGSISFRRAG